MKPLILNSDHFHVEIHEIIPHILFELKKSSKPTQVSIRSHMFVGGTSVGQFSARLVEGSWCTVLITLCPVSSSCRLLLPVGF